MQEAAPQAEKEIVRVVRKVVVNRLRETIQIQVKCLNNYRPDYFEIYPMWKVPGVEPLFERQKKMDIKYNYPPKKKKFVPTSSKSFMTLNYSNSIFSNVTKRFYSNIINNNANNLNYLGLYNKQISSFTSKSEKGKSDNDVLIDLTRLNISDHIEILTSSKKPVEIKSSSSDFDLEANLIEFDENTNWEEKVLNSELPVVVDCYADWCGPCKKLFPMLKKAYTEQKNFRLIKINIDENQQLAEKLNISSIPAVFLVYKGNIIDHFVGLPQQSKLDEFFSNISLLTGLGKEEEIFQKLLIGFDDLMKKKEFIQAENMLNEAFSHEKWRKKYGYLIKLGFAIVNFNKGELTKSAQFIKDITELHKTDLTKDSLAAKKSASLDIQIEIISNKQTSNTDLQTLVDAVKSNPKDLESRFLLSGKFFLLGSYEASIEELLQILKIDKNYGEKKAYNQLLKVFSALGGDNKLVVEGRKKLAKLIF